MPHESFLTLLRVKFLSMLLLGLLAIACSPTIPAAQNKPQNEAPGSPSISIFRAASEGNVTAVQNLLNAGTDVNAREHEGETPLMYAAVAGKTQVVKLLLERGADINAVSSNRETALARAVGVKQYETVKLLLDRGADIEKSTDGGGPPLIYAAGRDDAVMVKLLLERGAHVNNKDDEGNTALISAAENNASIETVELLLKAGADRNVKTVQGERPYDIALRYDNRVLARLMKPGTD